MGGKKPSGAAKREEEAIERAREEMERLKLEPTALWTGLVLHHRDIFVSHVLPKLNDTDRYFFSKANSDGENLLKYAEIDLSKLRWSVNECSSISTLEWAWNNMEWGEKTYWGSVMDQPWFCSQVALTNKLEFLKWAREVKHCEWDEETIKHAIFLGNLEMVEYCLVKHNPCDDKTACNQAAMEGQFDCLRFLLDKLKPSPGTKRMMTIDAAGCGHLNILKYCIEEKKITDWLLDYIISAAGQGKLTCLKYLVEEVKAPLLSVHLVSAARYKEQHECENYLLEKGAPEPTDQEYEDFLRQIAAWERRILP